MDVKLAEMYAFEKRKDAIRISAEAKEKSEMIFHGVMAGAKIHLAKLRKRAETAN